MVEGIARFDEADFTFEAESRLIFGENDLPDGTSKGSLLVGEQAQLAAHGHHHFYGDY